MKIILLFINVLLFPPFSFAQESKNYEALVSTLEVNVKKDGSSTFTTENVFRVLTEQGRSELSLYKIRVDETESKFQLLEAFSVNQNKKSIVQEKSLKTSQSKDTKNFGLSGQSEIIVPFDNVSIGSEVHIRYKILQKPFLGNIFSSTIAVSNESLAKKEHYKFTSEIPLFFRDDNLAPYFVLKSRNESNQFVVEISPSPQAYIYEGIINETGVLHLTSAANWKQIQENAAKKYSAAISEPPPEKLQKIIAGAGKQSTKKEMIEFAAREINKVVAYSGNWTTKDGKWFPQGIKKTLDTGKGDCKDYSTLMTAVLRGIGFESYPFLTFRSRAYVGQEKLSRLSGLASPELFNHVIVWAKDKEGKVWWVDPTNPYVQADTITSDILGNFGIVLDGHSENAIFLPSRNLDPADLNLEQTLTVNADNSVNGTGKIRMSPSFYNSIAMLERQSGPEATKGLVKVILNPTSKKTELELKKVAEKTPGYDYTFRGTDWVQEEFGKYKAITIFNVLGLTLQSFKPKAGIDIGEPGTAKIITHLRGQKEMDSIRAGCLLRSKWIDVDRIVENKPQEVTITDIIKIKERYISKQEASGSMFENIQQDLVACSKNSALVLSLNESLKSPEIRKIEKLKGPAVEAMSDVDAKTLAKLLSIQISEISGYIPLKLFRYHEKRVNDKKASASDYVQMSEAVVRLGFIKEHQYIPEHLIEGIRYLDFALQSAKEEVEVQAYAKKISLLLLLGNEKEANQVFHILHKKYPKQWLTYRSGAEILKKHEKYELAEKSLLLGEAIIKTKEQESEFSKSMYDLYLSQKKYKEVISYQERIRQKNPNNPWVLHNLADLYLQSGDFEKCIQLEKEVISSSGFAEAELTLSDAFFKKASSVHSKAQARQPSSLEPYEELLLEAIKYNNKNLQALTSLGAHYLQIYQRTQNKGDLQKGKPYLLQAMSIEPNNDKVKTLFEQYKKFD